MSCLQVVLIVIKNISIIFGISIAAYNLNSWRREHIGKRQMELAEDVLALFYEAKDAVSHIRNILAHSSETDEIERGVNESEAKWNARKQASVVFVRYNSHSELFGKINAMRYRFMAQVGKKDAEPFNDLNKIINDILRAARSLARLWARDTSRLSKDRQQKHEESIEKYEEIFWDGSDDDEINTRVDAVIENIESICRPIIMGKSRKRFSPTIINS